jgi:glucose/arabinose dehydrogenase
MKRLTRRFVLTLSAAALGAGFTVLAQQPARPLGALIVPPGFKFEVFAENVTGARMMALGSQGTVFVGSMSGGVYAVVDRDGDHKAERVVTIATGLPQPNGVAMRDGALYVATASRLLRFDDIERHLDAPPTPVVVRDSLPNGTGGYHSWKFIAFGPDDRLYMSVGVPCNVCAPPAMTASILRMNPDGSDVEVFAEGVRNSVGFAWHPVTHELWFTDNGRDMLGDDVPNDELNVAYKAGLHFGFPFCHQGDIPDPEFGAQRACSTTEAPVQKLGAHVAAIGFTFYTGDMFPSRYKNAAIIAEHGSWNRTTLSGYRVMAAFTDGRRVTAYEPLLDGFLPASGPAVGGRGGAGVTSGRPADALQMPDGSILISDDTGNRLIRVSYTAGAK